MGFGKAGWYSYDLLDNLGRKSATTVRSDWVVQSAGDTVPAGPLEFIAAVVEPASTFVLQLPRRRALGYQIDFTLAYQLDSSEVGTRLVSRARLNIAGPGGRVVSKLMLLGDGLMVRRQLYGLRNRCEAT